MKRRNAFSACHPLVNFCYYALVLSISVLSMQPVLLGLSLLGGICSYAVLRGRRAVGFCLRAVLPVMLLAAVCNPAFSHRGATVLGYFPTGNALTLESILYGLAAGVLLGAVLLWFACCTEVLTTDKLLYLFGRAAPHLALLLSMILRFVPAFSGQLRRIREAQRGLQPKPVSGLRNRLRQGAASFSILVTWALEHAVETADSMRSRGYGLPGRTAFSRYRFSHRDALLLGIMALPGAWLIYGLAAGALKYSWYPRASAPGCSPLQLSLYLAWSVLLAMPVILEGREARIWRSMKSAI